MAELRSEQHIDVADTVAPSLAGTSFQDDIFATIDQWERT
jgi:hypothetical protein